LTSILKFCVGEGLLAAFQAIARIVGQDLDQDTRCMFNSTGDKVQHWVEQPAVHMTIKKLIQFDKLRSGPPYFSQVLIDEVDSELVKEWIGCNRGAFVLVTMMETDIDSVKKVVTEKVKPFKKFLQKQTNKGADMLDSKICDF
jgi:pumilio family protein 6